MGGGDAEQGLECGVAGTAAIEAEDKLVEIGVDVLAAQAMIDPQCPDLEIGEDAVAPRQETMWAAILPMT